MATSDDAQARVFLKWVNSKLAEKKMKIDDLKTGFHDGTALCALCEILHKHKVAKRGYNKHPKMKVHMLENINLALAFLKKKKSKIVGIGNTAIYDGNMTMILGLLWSMIHEYQAAHGADDKELLKWAKAKTAHHDHTRVRNLHKSWKDGHAFCALLHTYRPDLLDFSAADKMTDKERLELAFKVATDLGVPALLEVDDFSGIPDAKAISTYLGEMKAVLDKDALLAEGRAAAVAAKLAEQEAKRKAEEEASRAAEEKARAEAEAARLAAEKAAAEKAAAEAARLAAEKAAFEKAAAAEKAAADKAAKAKAAAEKAAAAKAAADAAARSKADAAAAILQGQKETAWGAWQAILAASWAQVFADEAKFAYDDAVAMTGTDCFAALDGPAIGVFETREEAVASGATKVSGFCDCEYAVKLCKAMQGGDAKWGNFLADDTVYEAEDDEDDDDDSDSDSDSDDDGPKKPKWPYPGVKKGNAHATFKKQRVPRLLVQKKAILKSVSK